LNKKLLITGANGFVGSWMVEEAIAQGFHVYAGVRKSSNLQYLTDPRIHFFYYSFEQEDKLREQLVSHNFDYIILNAGVTTAKNRESYFKINSGYTRKFCRILMEEQLLPTKLVYVSSLASYGPANLQMSQVLDKDSIPHPVTWYGESKLQAEQFIQSFRILPTLIFRPTAVYGPRDHDMVSVYKTIQLGIGPKIGAGDMDATFIYVKDLAKLIIDSLEARAARKAYFVGDGTVYPIHTLNDILAKLLDKRIIKVTLPFFVMQVAGFISEMVGKLQGKTPLLNRNKVKEYYARSFEVDIADLKKDFNFAPAYDLETGLKETLEWCKANNLL
jgi:nucleoside-diphosphate-sugar epimerase